MKNDLKFDTLKLIFTDYQGISELLVIPTELIIYSPSTTY